MTARVIPTAIGPLTAVVDEGAILELHTGAAPAPKWEEEEDSLLLDRLQAQLTEYFSGKRQAFDLPLAPVGTAFQKEIWSALRTVPYGETRTYGDIAALLHRPKAARAVGGACGKNPILLLTPCHRILGSGGAMTGFSAEGGIAVKQQLLTHEARHKAIQEKYQARVTELLEKYPQLAELARKRAERSY